MTTNRHSVTGGSAGDPRDTGASGADGTRSEAEGRAHLRGSALLVSGRLLSLLIGLATNVVMVRSLTKSDYGAFEFALTLASTGGVLLSLGQGRLLSRFMATYEEERDFPRMFGAMFLAVGTILATSIPAIAVLFLFRDTLLAPAVESDRAVAVALILIFVAPMEALDQVFVSLFAVFSRPRTIFFRKHLLTPGLRFSVVMLLVVTGSGVTFLAVGYLLASVIGLGLYSALLIRVLRERGLLREFHPCRIILPFRAVFGFSLPLLTGELALVSLRLGGVLVLALYHPVSEVADYRVVFSTARLNTALTASFATLFLPAIARLVARKDIDGLRRTYWHTAAFIAVFTFPIFAMTGPFASATTVTLFGQRYAESATVLAILATGYYINVALGFNAYALQVCGRIKFLVGVNITIAVLNIALCVVFAPELGAVGIAVANSTSLITQNVLNQLWLRRSIETSFIDRGCWVAYGLIVGGAALLWVVAYFFSPGIFLGLVLAAIVSLGVLLGGQRALQLADTFPELRRVPLLARLVR